MFSGEIYEVFDKNHTSFKTYGEIKLNNEVLIRRDQFVPFDAVLSSEQCFLDLSFLTGESYPQLVHRGDTVAAGSRVLEDNIHLICTQEPQTTRLAQSLAKLDLMVGGKNKFQSLTDVIAHRLTLTVFGLAILYFAITYQSLGYESFKRCLALITIACPCAVAFGTPLAHNLGMVLAMRKGFMIKSETVFEKLNEIKRIIFDKTGTLTSSDLKLIKTFPNSISEEYRKIILGLEKRSMHPIALSLKKNWSQSDA